MMTETRNGMKHFIIDVTVETNDIDVRSRFISDSAGLDLLEKLNGQPIGFGELYDEYYEVKGVFNTDLMEIIEITKEEADTLIKYVGRSLSTYYLPDYFNEPIEE